MKKLLLALTVLSLTTLTTVGVANATKEHEQPGLPPVMEAPKPEEKPVETPVVVPTPPPAPVPAPVVEPTPVYDSIPMK